MPDASPAATYVAKLNGTVARKEEIHGILLDLLRREDINDITPLFVRCA